MHIESKSRLEQTRMGLSAALDPPLPMPMPGSDDEGEAAIDEPKVSANEKTTVNEPEDAGCASDVSVVELSDTEEDQEKKEEEPSSAPSKESPLEDSAISVDTPPASPSSCETTSTQQKKARKRSSGSDDTDDVILLDDDEEEEVPAKRMKALRSSASPPSSSASTSTAVQDGKCKTCRQRLRGIVFCPNFDRPSVSEKQAWSDPKIRVEGSTERDVRQALITNYVLHDREGHLINLTSGLVEEGKTIYFSGYLKGVFDIEPNSIENGVLVTTGGPIKEFWSTGFESGEQPVIGISTAKADYYLKQPNKKYQPLIQELTERTALSKLVIEVVKEAMNYSSDLTYEDGLERVANKAASVGFDMFSEEVLLRHAEAVIDQINSYEEAEDVEIQEIVLMHSTFVKELMDYAGIVRKPQTHKKERAVVRRRNSNLDEDYSPSDDDRDEDYNYKPSSHSRYSYKRRTTATTRAPPASKATTTPLVRYVFEKVFKNQIAANDDKKKAGASGFDASPSSEQACGICRNCTKQDCGMCVVCKDKAIFGGEGKGKSQVCMERTCLSVDILEIPVTSDDQVRSKLNSLKEDNRVEFLGAPLKVDKRKTYYESARVKRTKYSMGDCVMIRPDIAGTACFIGRILYFFEEGNEKIAHVHYFCHSSDTVLGELSDPKELFALDDCEDVQLFELRHKVNVSYWPVPEDWREQGGTEDAVMPPPVADDQFSFWFRMKYEPRHARFTKVDYDDEFSTDCDPELMGTCRLCNTLNKQSFKEVPKAINPVDSSNYKDKSTKEYTSFELHGETFAVGDAVYLAPSAFEMPYEMKKESSSIPKNQVKVDGVRYPEYHKHTGNVKGSNELTPDPFRIVVVERIAQKPGDTLMICVRKMYRPENTLQGESEELTLRSDINLVFWSDDLEGVPASLVEGKCFIRPRQVLKRDPAKWHEEGLHRFYFEKKYDSKTQSFSELHQSVIDRYKDKNRYPSSQGSFPSIQRPLATLDVFAGCGGLSLGLERAGVSKSRWAIENFPPAAKAFEINHPGCNVITADCNQVLQEVMDGHTSRSDGTALPVKGEVELLCGGPPCQGFSTMNIFTEREYSQFKNSLISSYLSYCDYYRPKYFILENVMNFACYKSNLVLKLCLRALNMMGYQCTFGILQAGSFGVPQTRRRAILLAAAPDQVLPKYPEPRHVFDRKSMKLSVVVDKKNFATDTRWTDLSAPYRTITIRDAMDDLPEVKIGASREELKYKIEPRSHFQRIVRREHGGQGTLPILYDHVTKNFSPLISERIRRIPLEPGSDWRDLPNVVCELSDGTYSEKLIYSYREPGSRIKNAVCCCQVGKGKKCDPSDKQNYSLIPWAMNHTSRRHNNWAGIYGRVSWDGFFSTTVTNPEPMAKQGRVLHPEQHRVVSVRECARSQGFPDWFRFYGTILEKHRQIGNAVPPPMGMALGHEIRKAVASAAEAHDIQVLH